MSSRRSNELSIIIPTLNRPNTIEKNLISILNGTVKPFEIIIIDQSDNNKIKTIAAKYKPQLNIAYIHTDEKSSSKARNIGIRESKTDILVFLDDDAYVEKDTLEKISDAMKNQKIAMISARNTNSRPQKKESILGYIFAKKNYFKRNIGHVTKSIYGRFPVNENQQAKTEWAMGYCFVVRRSLLQKYKILFDERLAGYSYGEDLDFTYRYYKNATRDNYDTIYMPEIKVLHEGSKEHRTQSKKVTYMQIINREYFSYKWGLGPLSRLMTRYSNLGTFFYRLVHKDTPLDVIKAQITCDRKRNKIKKGLLDESIYE